MNTRALVYLVCILTAASACKTKDDNPGGADAGAGADAAAGQPDANAGVLPDAAIGGVSLQIACTNVCDKGEQCFGPAAGDCSSECMSDLTGVCSQQEINQLDGCASLADCGGFEDCIAAVPCVGAGPGPGPGPGVCHEVCETGANQESSCGTCQADVCAADPFCCETEWDSICVGEAESLCGVDCPSVCGDFVCDDDEDLDGCPNDCAGICGNDVCEAGEDCVNCAGDCGACVCGDDVCQPGECSTCANDCPNGCTCGDVCETGPAQDPSCGQCQADICAADSFCCEFDWDGLCVSEAETICNKDCPSVCGDFFCDADENETSCPNDCGAPPPPNP